MKDKKGYKKTQLGMIPDNWKIIQLKDIGNIITGNTPKTANKEFYDDGSYLWATPFDLGKSKYIVSTKTQLSKLGFKQVRKIPKGGILVTCIGSTIGKTGMAITEMGTNQQINSVICNTKTDANYYYYVISKMGENIRRLAATQAVPIINKSEFSKLFVYFPPLPEQKKIADILTTVDEKIESIEKQIEQTELLKKGLMQRLFTQGIGHTEFKNTKIGRIPKEWEVERFNNICSLSKERVTPFSSTINYKCVELEHISQNTGKLIGYTNLKKLKSQKTVFKKEDVLFGKLRPYLKKFLYANFDGVCTTEIWVLKTDKVLKKWLFYIIQTRRILNAANQSEGTKMPRADWEIVGNTFISCPPLGEQKKIASILSIIDGKLEILQEKKAQYLTLKKGLMQKLLTGQIRVETG